MLLQRCVLIHKNVPQETIQLYHLNFNILTHCNLKVYKIMKRIRNHVLKAMICKKIVATLTIR